MINWQWLKNNNKKNALSPPPTLENPTLNDRTLGYEQKWEGTGGGECSPSELEGSYIERDRRCCQAGQGQNETTKQKEQGHR